MKRSAFQYETITEDDIDQLYGDLWERVYANCDIIKREGFRNYLFIALNNRIKDFLRNRERSDDLLVRDPSVILQLDESLDAVDDTGFEVEAREEKHKWVEMVMAGMPKTLALVGTWYHVENLSQMEIAGRLNVSQPGVSRMIKEFDRLFKQRYQLLQASDRGFI